MLTPLVTELLPSAGDLRLGSGIPFRVSGTLRSLRGSSHSKTFPDSVEYRAGLQIRTGGDSPREKSELDNLVIINQTISLVNSTPSESAASGGLRQVKCVLPQPTQSFSTINR